MILTLPYLSLSPSTRFKIYHEFLSRIDWKGHRSWTFCSLNQVSMFVPLLWSQMERKYLIYISGPIDNKVLVKCLDGPSPSSFILLRPVPGRCRLRPLGFLKAVTQTFFLSKWYLFLKRYIYFAIYSKKNTPGNKTNPDTKMTSFMNDSIELNSSRVVRVLRFCSKVDLNLRHQGSFHHCTSTKCGAIVEMSLPICTTFDLTTMTVPGSSLNLDLPLKCMVYLADYG